MNLTIITPSICRPDLHNTVLPYIISVIKASVHNIHWIINIDPVPTPIQDETEKNFLSIASGINSTILKPQNACFFQAIRNLGIYASKYNFPVLHLEDDWQLTDEQKFRTILSSQIQEWHYYCFTGYNFRNLNPGLWGISAFKECFVESFKKCGPNPTTVIDPEHLVHGQSVPLLEQIPTDRIFIDAGESWRQNMNLKKWNTMDLSYNRISYL